MTQKFQKFILMAAAILSISLIPSTLAQDRKVSVEWNPGCDGTLNCNTTNDHGSFSNLIYVQLTGPSDVIHLLYSDIRSFSIMLFRTNLSAQISVNWSNLLSNETAHMKDAISFSEPALEQCGYLFTNIFEFDDEDTSADMRNANVTYVHKTAHLIWKKFALLSNDSGVFEGIRDKSVNGSFKFQVKFPGQDSQRDKTLPHLLLNSKSTSVNFIVDSFAPKFNRSKFALNTILLTESKSIDIVKKKALDDEYTPGTFELYNTLVKDETSAQVLNYLQWKPIFYYYDPKSLENSTITKQYELRENDSLADGLALVFCDTSKRFAAVNVSFGLAGNEKQGYFYKQTNYSSFSFSVGLGAPLDEKMSFIVTLVIFVGFGLPALVIVIGLIVMIYRKLFRSNRSEYSGL